MIYLAEAPHQRYLKTQYLADMKMHGHNCLAACPDLAVRHNPSYSKTFEYANYVFPIEILWRRAGRGIEEMPEVSTMTTSIERAR